MSKNETQNEAPTEAKEPSLRDALNEQIEAHKEAQDASTPDKEEESAEETEVTEETEKETEEVTEPETEEPVKEETKEEEPSADIPNNWNEEEKQAFMDIPDEIIAQDGTEISLKAMKDVILNRHENLLKGFNEKAREAAAAKKGSEEWNKLLDPYNPQLSAAGMTQQQWIGTILQRVNALQANPASAIKNLISEFRLTATDLNFKTEQSEDLDYLDGQADPKVTQLETTVKNLQRRLDDDATARVQQQSQSVQNELAAFRDETDSTGNLIRPHFDEARDEMGILMQTRKAKTMQEAYNMSPAVKSKGLEVVTDPEDNKLALKKAREEAAKAKKAGKTVKTRSGQTNAVQGLGLRETLVANYRGLQQ